MSNAKGCVGILFVLSLIAGVILGFLAIDPDGGSFIDLSTETYPPSTSPGHSIMIIGVDNLERSDPGIEGVWLVNLPVSNGGNGQEIHIDLFTLYPITQETIMAPELSKFAQPHPRIVIDPDNPLSSEAMMTLAANTDDLTGIILMDEYIINMVLLLHNPKTELPVPPPDDNLFIKSWEDPQGAFEQQKAILTTLCDHPEPLSKPTNIAAILEMENIHIKSNLGEGSLLRWWQVINLTRDKQVSCDIYP